MAAPYEDIHQESIDRVVDLFLQGIPISVAWSGGKDSSVLLDLTLTAAMLAKEQGANPYILVTNGDTGVENPEISAYVKKESEKIIDYAGRNGIRLDYHVASPTLNSSWAVRIIGGRALPSFPSTNHDCTVDWKVLPMTRLRKQLMKTAIEHTGKEVITLVGTRYSESAARAKNMAERQDSHERPTRNAKGDLTFPVIANWETDDVWMWVGLAANNLIPSYSDFEDMKRIYADAGGTSCAVVSDSITEGMKAARGACGARTGCIQCVAVAEDKSLNAMLEMDKQRYGYMEGANRLREFIANTQWDFGRRQWIGRTVDDDGMIAIRPDTYSPAMCLDLLRYALTVDAEEREAALNAGLSSPRFELVSLQSIVAIDALWSLQSMHRPFTAVKEYIDITENGMRYPVPEVQKYPRIPMPATRYLFVGEAAHREKPVYDGLRDVILDLVNDPDRNGCMGNRTLSNGKTVLDVEVTDTFDVDLEGAYLALDFERDRMLEIHNNASGTYRLAEGYRWWVRMGVISLSPQQVSLHDEILKRNAIKERLGIAGPNVDLDYVFSLTEQQGGKPVAQPKEKEKAVPAVQEFQDTAKPSYAQADLFSFMEEEEDDAPAMR